MKTLIAEFCCLLHEERKLYLTCFEMCLLVVFDYSKFERLLGNLWDLNVIQSHLRMGSRVLFHLASSGQWKLGWEAQHESCPRGWQSASNSSLIAITSDRIDMVVKTSEQISGASDLNPFDHWFVCIAHSSGSKSVGRSMSWTCLWVDLV